MSSGPTVNPVPKDAATGEILCFASAWEAEDRAIPPPPVQDPPMREFRGNTLGQSFHFRERMKLSRDKPIMGFWYGAFPYPNVARVIAQAGFDYVMVDWEHTAMSIEGVCEIIRWINHASEGNTAVVARVPSHDHVHIAWVLDAGASAVVLPHTETAEQARQAVKNARFPKYGGTRSRPPNALLCGYNDGATKGGGAQEVWNRAAVIMQIESAAEAEMADAIAAVEGVDGLMVGPSDLAFDLGMANEDEVNAEYDQCVNLIADAARKYDKAALAPSDASWLEKGYTMVMCGNDGMILAKGLRNGLIEGYKVMDAWKEKNKAGGQA